MQGKIQKLAAKIDVHVITKWKTVKKMTGYFLSRCNQQLASKSSFILKEFKMPLEKHRS